MQPGDMIVGDEDGLVVFPYADASRLLEAARKSAAAERAIREEIMTGEERQSWMDKIFAANGLG